MGLKQSHAIFLSAGVPDPAKPHFVGEADTAAISAVVSALLFVVLGRRPIVWGGHPAITPMIWAFAEGLGVDYSKWVTLYQSAIFEDYFPEENARFANVIVTENVNDNINESLNLMRRRMLSEHQFDAAVFAGGMAGLYDEYDLVRELAPDAQILPIVSTGGAAEKLGADLRVERDLVTDLDYVSLFFRRLSISPEQSRGK
ncbi:hypothetical protein [Brucella anthropi]|uniref:SLOG domain-containing protein n=1 Tax=Brucella anthropi TaxID=529 RepID=UPI000CFDA0A7|nr:hypothetical protein [Ochrobactrum sp. MYb49]PQZ61818.1 hypothetical protein CQ057_22890 [Ochrobactrum sp. MYb49]